MQKHKPRSGLGIKASIVRYGDPGVLLDLPAKVRAWRAAGSPKHFILLPEVIYGAEAVSQNRRSRAGRALYEDFRKAWRSILRDVVTMLLDARLVAYPAVLSRNDYGFALWERCRRVRRFSRRPSGHQAGSESPLGCSDI